MSNQTQTPTTVIDIIRNADVSELSVHTLYDESGSPTRRTELIVRLFTDDESADELYDLFRSRKVGAVKAAAVPTAGEPQQLPLPKIVEAAKPPKPAAAPKPAPAAVEVPKPAPAPTQAPEPAAMDDMEEPAATATSAIVVPEEIRKTERLRPLVLWTKSVHPEIKTCKEAHEKLLSYADQIPYVKAQKPAEMLARIINGAPTVDLIP